MSTNFSQNVKKNRDEGQRVGDPEVVNQREEEIRSEEIVAAILWTTNHSHMGGSEKGKQEGLDENEDEREGELVAETLGEEQGHWHVAQPESKEPYCH